MKYYIIAGEASGDLHASNLMRQLKARDADADFRFWGGDLMASQGGELVMHYRDLAFMGFAEVVANLRTIARNLAYCRKDILKYRPDVLILVDYPGFNLRIARFAHRIGIKTFYYISPQVWAWKKSRVFRIRRYVDRMFVILPFEKDFYAHYNMDVHFVGHPLLDAIENEKPRLMSHDMIRREFNLDNRPLIALLPGSRRQEISRILPVMLSVQERFHDYQLVVAGAPSVPKSFYRQFMKYADAKIIFGKTHSLLNNAKAALVTSGTATLETALLKVPEVVCYKGSFLSYQIAKRIVDIRFISLVNLIMDRQVVAEIIQTDLTKGRLVMELEALFEPDNRQRILDDYELLRKKLGGAGASAKAAELMLKALK